MTKIISGAIICSIAALGLAAMPASAGKYNNSNMGGVGHSNGHGGYHKPIFIHPKAYFGPIKGPGFGGRPVVVIPKRVPIFRGFRGGHGMW